MYARLLLNGWTLSGVALMLTTAGCSAPENVIPEDTSPVSGPVATQPEAPESPIALAEEQVPLATAEATTETTTEATTKATGDATEDALPAVSALSGKEFVNVMEETIGKVTILNLWATWCPPCVKEMPDLVRIYNETDRDKVAFVSLSLDGVAEISGAIPPFQKEHAVPFPIYVISDRDDEAMLKAIRQPFRGGIPVTYIYDKSGKNVSVTEGPIGIKELHEILAPLL